MSFDADEEILQDFLVEAGEILEQLGEQLVELEQQPGDDGLLNAVFRGFHTIKGGAGFLNLIPLVEVCHRAEDVFNVLRTGERKVDSGLMDVILPVVDVLNVMFDSIRSGVEPEPASPELLRALEGLIGDAVSDEQEGATDSAAPVESVAEKSEPVVDSAEQEFDA
ncbi:MAG TPA: chemotaxis protein CheA, partial [Gammaproteobacteria bacterium]|nr:chemotaxis protein CheA [Gammaproteobacteria bacterium]